jgi:hypothetical protein
VQNVQSTDLPAVSYQMISAPTDYTHDGTGMTIFRVQLTVTALTYASLVAVATSLRTALGGVRNGGYVYFVENELDGISPPAGQAGYYLRRMDVSVQDP